MPDTFYQPHRAAIIAGKRVAFSNRWEDERDYHDRIQRDAGNLLETLDTLRSELLWAHEVKEVDDFAADFAGTLHDLLSDRIGRFQKEGETLGFEPEEIDHDMSILSKEVDLWLARAKARRAEIVYMTAADLGLPTPTSTKDTTNA